MSDRFYSLSRMGHVRSSNQDRVLARPDLGLWVVADGMGGHAGGAEASRIACETVEQAVECGMTLEDAFEVAHSQVRTIQNEKPEFSDMGTTLVAVREQGETFHLAWVGDSRIYQYHAKGGTLECLTQDHNVAARLLAAGQITAAQARNHPQRHMLTDCIGQRDGLPTIESATHRWASADRLLLCTDGLTGEVDDTEVERWLSSSNEPQAIATGLADEAMNAGGRDNITLIVLQSPS